jgi:hypothetical protein
MPREPPVMMATFWSCSAMTSPVGRALHLIQAYCGSDASGVIVGLLG